MSYCTCPSRGESPHSMDCPAADNGQGGGWRLCLCGKPKSDSVHHRPQTSDEEHPYEPAPTEAELYEGADHVPEEVERVARALFDAHEVDLDLPERWQWDDATEAVRGYYRRLAEAAVAAMTRRTAPPDPHTAAHRRTTQEESK